VTGILKSDKLFNNNPFIGIADNTQEHGVAKMNLGT
jgi:hypothetical protein